MIKKIILLVFVFTLIIAIPSASAVRISPALAILQFEPNLELNYTFSIMSDKSVPTYHRVHLVKNNSALAPYIDGWDEPITEKFEPKQSRQYSFVIILPATMEPGDHEIAINADVASDPNSRSSGMGAFAGVGATFKVRVPYPGLYAKIDDVGVPQVAEMGYLNDFVAAVHNYGEQTISSATIYLTITDPEGSVVHSSTTNTVSLAPTEKKELSTEWTPENVPLGLYTADFELRYDGGNSYTKDRQFWVGDEYIEITYIPELEIAKNTIASTYIQAKSHWSEEIENVYVEVDFAGKTFKSESVNFPTQQTKNITVFIDSTGVVPGEYKANATLYYAGKIESQEFDVKVVSISKIMLYSLIGIAVVIIIAIILLVFFLSRRKGKH